VPLLMCDLDDTLVARRPLFLAWARAFLAERGRPDLLDWVVEQDHGGHAPREPFLSALAEETGSEVSLEEYESRLGGSYRLTDDTVEVLDAAREAGWTLAVVTNGPTVGQTRKIRATGLDARADAVCISEEVGVRKPDPLIFETAARRAGTSLTGAWMVGDNLDADIAGGAAVGACTAWVKRPWDVLSYTSDVEPDLTVDSFADAVRRILDA
jgi:HAD superfamily hydrolase (TIGR01549 family)